MALSGYIEEAFRAGYKFRIGWVINSQSVADNTSNVTFTVYLVSESSSAYINSTGYKELNLWIDGTNYYRSERGMAQLAKNQTKPIMSQTLTIQHSDNGTKSVTLYSEFGIECTLGGTFYDTVYCGGTVELERIARPSTPVVAGAMNVGSAATITMNRNGFTDLYHHLFYSLNVGSSWTQITSNYVTDSYSWTVPDALGIAIPNAVSNDVQIKCTTYQKTTSEGVDTYTSIGDKIITKTYGVPASYSPTTTFSASSTDALGSNNYIQGISVVTLSATATTRLSATVSRFVFEFAGTSQTVVPQVGSTTGSVSFTLASNAPASMAVSVTAYDSRGYSATQNLTLTIQTYSAPQITSIDYQRGNIVDGVFVESNSGRAIRFISEGVITQITGNAKYYKIEYRLPTETNYTILVLATPLDAYAYELDYTSGNVLNENASYVFKVSIIDSFKSTISIIEVPAKRVLMNFSANGRAVCIGGIASVNDACEIQMQSYQTGGVKPMTIANGTDFNSINRSGEYIGNASTGSYTHCPLNSDSFRLQVDIGGSAGQVLQRITSSASAAYKAFVRLYNESVWSEWIAVEGNPVLSLDEEFCGQIEHANGLLMQWGVVIITPANENTVTEVSVNFQTEFAVLPHVSASPIDEYPNVVTTAMISDVSSDAFSVSVSRTNANPVMVSWFAIGGGE